VRKGGCSCPSVGSATPLHMVADACMARIRSMSMLKTNGSVSSVGLLRMGGDAFTAHQVPTGTATEPTSASGVAQPAVGTGASTALQRSTKNRQQKKPPHNDGAVFVGYLCSLFLGWDRLGI
jgi:hypothetical protein